MEKEPEKSTLGLTLTTTAEESGASVDAGKDRDQTSVVKFTVGDSCFAVGVEHTEGIVDCPRISPLPAPPEGIVGVASVRGRITVVMDLSLNADLRACKRRLILLKGDAQLGLLADRVDGVIALPMKQKRTRSRRRPQLKVPTSDTAKKWPVTTYLSDGPDRIPVLDVEQLVAAHD